MTRIMAVGLEDGQQLAVGLGAANVIALIRQSARAIIVFFT